MIPQYPSFSLLTKDNLAQLCQIVSNYNPYSDFSVTSLYCWSGKENKTSISLLKGSLVVKLQNYITGEQVVTVLGSKGIDDVLHSLLSDTDVLALVPEEAVNSLQKRKDFEITEDADNNDYIYTVTDLALMEGGQYKKKRNKLAKLKKLYGDALSSETRELKSQDQRVVLQLFDEWVKSKGGNVADPALERDALRRIFEVKGPHILLTLVRYREEVVGFSLNEILPNGFAICHFEKSLKTPQNVCLFLISEVANELMARKVRWVNWEQDLGIVSLRLAKLSYRPTKYLRKYTITRP